MYLLKCKEKKINKNETVDKTKRDNFWYVNTNIAVPFKQKYYKSLTSIDLILNLKVFRDRLKYDILLQ